MKALLRFVWLVLMWAVLTVIYIPAYLLGMIAVPIAAGLKRYTLSKGYSGACYVWNDKFMRLWQTHDNGCCPEWYIKTFGKSRSLWANIVIWSAFRNPFGGNPAHAYGVPISKMNYWGTPRPDVDGIAHFKKTGKRKWHWRFIQHGWRVGFWASYPLMRENDNFDVIDVQHGFKTNGVPKTENVNLVFSPWDTGRRRN